MVQCPSHDAAGGDRALGHADKVIAHDDGTQEMVYERKIPPSDAKSYFVYQVKDGQVIKQCWKEF